MKPKSHLSQCGPCVKSMVYGGMDGIVTTFAVVSGVTGASLSAGVILVLGFANLIADGISMATADYLSSKAEQELTQTERAHQRWHIHHDPEEMRDKLAVIYAKQGMSKTDSKKIVRLLSKNEKVWADTVLAKKEHMIDETESPRKMAAVTFGSFVLFGFVPLFAYVISKVLAVEFNTFVVSSVLAGLTLFVLGTVKARITGMYWFKSGMQTLLVGGLAAAAAYFVGYGLAWLV
ncbi:MAG: VIT1/CCC1 transporter family protein [Candidatus Nanoarchaeia archaeon]